MFGNDPQCRAPNSGRRKAWSIEGIKQPLHLVRRPGHHHWADITLGGHQHIGRTSSVLGRTTTHWADINSWSGHQSGWTLQEERRLHRVCITFALEDT